MRFNLDRLNSDPTYAPGRVIDRGKPVWVAGKADVAVGYRVKRVPLSGDDLEQAAKCRDLTRELLRWREGEAKINPGTWGWVIARYKSDEFSAMQDVKENTREGYLWTLAQWEKMIANVLIAETDYARIKLWQKKMGEKGRSTSYIHRMFTMLRMVSNHGRKIAPKEFRDVCDILGAMRIKAAKPRTVAPTSDQILAIIAAADKAGDAPFALGLSLQWWLTLRAVDVRGQWLGKGSARRWADGLTWDMVDLGAKVIRKMVSKTEKHDDRPSIWDLSPLPDLVARLDAIPADERIGAVVKNGSKPFEVRHYRDLFRRYADAAKVPSEVQLMDTRAGALNDALRLGANHLQMQHQAKHKDAATTERYIRDRDTFANNVIAMRSRTKA